MSSPATAKRGSQGRAPARRDHACVVYPDGVNAQAVIDHGTTRLGRRLDADRVKVAVAIAAVEGILVLAGVIAWWAVVVLAIGATALTVWISREHPRHPARPLLWVAAVSQLLVVLVPILVTFVLGLVAVVIVAAVVVALYLLLSGR